MVQDVVGNGPGWSRTSGEARAPAVPGRFFNKILWFFFV